jgi:nitrous oxidase accessory protein NosD
MPRSINGYGSGRQWLFDGNQLTGPKIGGPSTAIDIGGSATSSMIGLQISNNSIQLSDVSSYPNGISVFDAVGTIVRGNTFLGVTASDNGGAGVALRAGAVNSEVSQNVVNSQNLKYGVLLQSGASGSMIHDNQFVSTRIGINVLSGVTNTNIGCNSFVNNGTNSADYSSGTIYTCSTY